jgi:hypothetical protein
VVALDVASVKKVEEVTQILMGHWDGRDEFLPLSVSPTLP